MADAVTSEHLRPFAPVRPKTGLNFLPLLALVCAFQASLQGFRARPPSERLRQVAMHKPQHPVLYPVSSVSHFFLGIFCTI